MNERQLHMPKIDGRQSYDKNGEHQKIEEEALATQMYVDKTNNVDKYEHISLGFRCSGPLNLHEDSW